MTKFITVSSLTLFWVFFEMSGGVDFVPPSEREAENMARATEVYSSLNYVPFDQPIITSEPEPRVATSQQQPTNVVQASFTDTPAVDTVLAGNPAVVQTVVPNFDAVNDGDEPATRQDIRIIAGDWVNMRQGPGTGFDVIETLPRGTEAEILQVSTDDWAQIRLLDGGETGWMAAWLLSD